MIRIQLMNQVRIGFHLSMICGAWLISNIVSPQRRMIFYEIDNKYDKVSIIPAAAACCVLDTCSKGESIKIGKSKLRIVAAAIARSILLSGEKLVLLFPMIFWGEYFFIITIHLSYRVVNDPAFYYNDKGK